MSAGRLSEATTVSSLESTTFSTVFPFLVSIYSTPLAEQYNGPTSVLATCTVPLWKWKSLCFCQSDTNISPLGEMARWGANPKLLDSPASVRTQVEGSPGFQLRMRRSMVCAANSVSWCQHKERVGKGSTSRPAHSVLAPKNGDQCFKQRLFDWKVPGLWVLPREAKASWTSLWSSSLLRPEKRAVRPRQITLSTERDWICTCCSSMPRNARLSSETLIQVKIALTTASSREMARSSLVKSRASWQSLSWCKVNSKPKN